MRAELWGVFYGQEETSSAVVPVESWAAEFGELLRRAEIPAEEGGPPASHKAHLFFLMQMLRGESKLPAAEESGLQGALLEKLLSVAGVALGGSAIETSRQETLRSVQPHSTQNENLHAESQGAAAAAPIPRPFLPIVATRNPFRKSAE